MKMRTLAFLAAAILAVMSLAASGCGDEKTSQNVPATGGQITPQFSEDIRMYEQALANDPKNEDLLIQLGNKYYDWGMDEVDRLGDKAEPVSKWNKGIDYYKRALAIDPNNVDVRTDMANLMNWMNRLDEAEQEYRKGMKIDPNHPQVRVNLILLLGGKMGRYKEAIKQYDDLLKVDPTQKNNLDLKAVVDRYRQELKEAKK